MLSADVVGKEVKRDINKIGHILPIVGLFFACIVTAGISQPNILLIVADDLNNDSLGYVNGGVAPEVTPNIDRLAEESFSFQRAFVTVSVCQPTRQSMLSGLLPHNYGSGGFFPMADGVPTLVTFLRDAGYLTGNIHKLHHMLPEDSFPWHFDNKSLGYTDPDGVVGRDPVQIAGGVGKFIREAEDREMPFFMVVNSADPHRPFHGDAVRGGDFFWGDGEIVLKEPSRIYEPHEVVIPPTLPDLPGIREDLAKYASSVRRLDDTVGACLTVLDELGKTSSTLVIFVSDKGMPLPFAKFDCYWGSNLTPLLIRWPEFIKEPKTDSTHLVSLMDLMPTILELAALPVPEGLDGKSLVPILENRSPEDWRDSIVFMRNEDIYYGSGIRRSLENRPNFIEEIEARGWILRPDHPSEGTFSRDKEIRSYFDGRYGYIYNHCYDPAGLELSDLGAIVPYGDRTYNAMKNAADDPAIKARYTHYLLRAQEELYDWLKDPGSQHNLSQDPEYTHILKSARAGLLEWMELTEDPLIEDFQEMIE